MRRCLAAGDNEVMADELAVAAAGPRTVDGDLAGNLAAHAELIRRANARLVVFPEMSLTGYLLDAAPVSVTGDRMAELVDACATAGSVALVGAPVETPDGRFIAALRVDADGAEVAYRKTFLAAAERSHFNAGDGPRAVEVDGWRIGVGICRDTGIEEHVCGAAALDVDVYACGVLHHDTELAEQRRRGRHIAETCRAAVVMSSFAGPTGGGYVRTAGRSAIWSAEAVALAEADDRPGGIARATLTR